jgi:predicted esterase
MADFHGPLIVRSVAAAVHGRYLFRRAEGSARLLVGFHGYGQIAETLLEQLLRIPGAAGWNVGSVQALHPFYRIRTNEVVASWMTRLDRELAIADNIAYVEAAVRDIGVQLGRAPAPLVYAGFSQGAQMAYRAALGSGFPVAGLVVLGGHVPLELLERAGEFPPVLIGHGSRDEMYPEEKLNKDLRFLGSRAQVVRMNAGHEWTDEFLVAAGEFLEEVGSAAHAHDIPV